MSSSGTPHGPCETIGFGVMRIVALLGLYALAGGLVSFLGWAADRPGLTDWLGLGISIQPNATIAAAGSGAALILLAWGFRRLAMALGAAVSAIGAISLLQWVAGVGLDPLNSVLMFGRAWGRSGV